MSFPAGKSQFYEGPIAEEAQMEGHRNISTANSFLGPTNCDPPPPPGAAVRSSSSDDNNEDAPSSEERQHSLVEQKQRIHAQQRRESESDFGDKRGFGPDFKDQMRHAQAQPHQSRQTTNRRVPIEQREFRNDEVQLVNAALVPDEELLQYRVKKNQQRSKLIAFGLVGAIVVNALLVSGALLAVFCITAGSCRRDSNDDDDEMPSLVSQCERATLVDPRSSKQRMSGLLDTSRQGRLCDPDIPGVWFKVIGTGQALISDTCSPVTRSDTTIAVFTGDCGNLTCLETKDDSTYCPHGDSLSEVGWFGVENETYFVRVSAFEQAALSAFSLAIREFSDQPPPRPCDIDSQLECRSSEGSECDTLLPPRLTTCREDTMNLQFLYSYAQCGQSLEGVMCEDYGNTPTSAENVRLGCSRPSPNSSEITIFNTTPSSFGQGELVTVRTLTNEPLHGEIGCDISSAGSGDLLQRVRTNLNQTSLGDTFGSLQVVACGTTSCFRELSITAQVANNGSRPVQIIDSSVDIAIDYSRSTSRVEDIFKSIVLNPDDTERRLVNTTLNFCQGSLYEAFLSVGGQVSGGDFCHSSSWTRVSAPPPGSEPPAVVSLPPTPSPRVGCIIDATLTCSLSDGRDCRQMETGNTNCFEPVTFVGQICNLNPDPLLVNTVTFNFNGVPNDYLESLAFNPIPAGECTSLPLLTTEVNVCQSLNIYGRFDVNASTSNGNSCMDSDQLSITTGFLPPPPIPVPIPPTPRPSTSPAPPSGLRTNEPTGFVDGSIPTQGPTQSTDTVGLLGSTVGRLLLAFAALAEVLLFFCGAFYVFRCLKRRQALELETLRRKQQEIKAKRDEEQIDEELDDEE